MTTTPLTQSQTQGQPRPQWASTNGQKLRAFTLIELLVVCAIVAILFALVATSVSRAKPQATKISCVSNLRQVGLALHMYTDESDDEYPPRIASSRSNWVARLKPYYLDTNILRCPFDPPAIPRSYLFNACNDWFKANLSVANYAEYEARRWPHGLKASVIADPAETAVFGEKRTESLHAHMDLLQNGGNDLEEIDHVRHAAASNIAFADGSVRTIRRGASISPVNLWAVTPEWRSSAAVQP